MNNFNAILAFYREYEEKLFTTPTNEWAIEPYIWQGFIRLTPIEEWLWEEIRACGAVLYPQFPVGRYFVDFCNPAAGIAIECDGAAFHQDKEKDAARDAEIETTGIRIYHLTGSDCYSDQNDDAGWVARGRRFIEEACKVYPIKQVYKPAPNGETARRIKVNQELMAQRMKETP